MLLSAVFVMSGCTINRDIMFKTPTDFEFDVLPDSTESQFRIQPNDVLQFRLFANDGFRMIDLVSDEGGVNARNLNRITFSFLVEFDGLVELPLIGRVKAAGLTLREAEFMMEERYVTYYNRPFVQLSVGNRRVVVYPGGGADAEVVQLENNNTTLLEALAQAGGLSRRGNAGRIKLFRRNAEGGRDIYMFDMSDIDGLQYGDLVMQADDIIYVEPNPELARELLYDLTPLITLLTSTVLVIGIVNGLQ